MQSQNCSYDLGPTPRRRRPAETTEPSSNQGDACEAAPLPPPPTNSQDSSEWISQHVGLSSDQDPFVLRHANFNESDYYKSGDWACLMLQRNSRIPSLFTAQPDSSLNPRSSYYPPSSLLDAAYPLHHDLLSTYFEVVHPSFPLLDPARFVKGNKIDLLLLAAMYILAQPLCPPAAGLSIASIDAFVSQALPVEARTPRLDTIEAALLFLQRCDRVRHSPGTAGVHAEIGTLVAMCYDAGLHVDSAQWNLSSTDRNRRKRIWSAAYIFDQWVALGLGRPPFIHEASFDMALLTPGEISSVTVNQAVLPGTSAQMFVAMVAMTKILAEVLTMFYTLKAAQQMTKTSPTELSSMKAHFEQQLLDLRTRCLAPPEHIANLVLDPTGTLDLAFYTIEVVLYRALLRCLPPTEPLWEHVRTQSRQCVIAISKLLENLQVTRLRAFWWSPISQLNFAMAGGFMFSVLHASSSDDDIQFWSSEITRYRRLLDMQSHSFDTTKYAVGRMSTLAHVTSSGPSQTSGDAVVDPKQAFCRDFGVELNTL
ncbi:hypothetical protein CB0940_04969 [Cercospora beticola]|uniref:Xylanolytic transcriptional activator regulatory domain-containing protein n=1 Tax=Cercospora beticola TaxID=122368 RepID=A0A2G5HLH4_CERBT|nr:hypothetical protein CB0940_04969 [Cercospora beticola]PIA93416.1 hypothetical protein CB0940_04969 [Cercospora beticola]WPB02257.1 hypothetical protein RHO25_006891 [Cercospora beticola]